MTVQFLRKQTSLLRITGLATICLLSCLAACGNGSPPGTAATESPIASPTGSPTPGEPLSGHLVFSRFDDATHTFVSHHVSLADGSEETEIKMPGSQGGGHWSHSGKKIAVSTELENDRVSTAIINSKGKVIPVFELPDKRSI
jgi:hypothetical protein